MEFRLRRRPIRALRIHNKDAHRCHSDRIRPNSEPSWIAQVITVMLVFNASNLDCLSDYSHQVTAGQRKYGGPPPDWTGSTTSLTGCEIFVGRIPKDVYEDELIVLFEKVGKLWDLRLMIDPLTSQSRGYAFITYCNKEDAQKAVQEVSFFFLLKSTTLLLLQYNGYKIRPKNLFLKVNISVPNLRLFIGNIPKKMSKEQIFDEFSKVTGNHLYST